MTTRTALTCGKCNGTGRYYAGGHCFACAGRGTVRVSTTALARIEHAKATDAVRLQAVKAVRAGLDVARAFVAAHRDDVTALCEMLSSLQDEGYRDEGIALHGWIARRFPGAVAC